MTRTVIAGLAAAVVATALGGCGNDGPGAPWQRQGSAAERAIGELIVSLVDAANSADIDAVLALYEDDAVLMPPFEKPIVGTDAIRTSYQEMFDAMELELGATIEEIVVSGRWAYSRGTTRGRVTPRDSAFWKEVNDKFVMVLHKRDRRWRIVRLIWNSNQ